MASTIKLKNGSGAPTTGDLVQGEPALDLTNKRLYTENASGVVIEVGTNPTSVTTGNITANGTINLTGATVSNAGSITTADINGGTIDGTVIGGTTAAAITGTTITGTSFVSSGNMTFGDDDEAIFGVGSDLRIYHSGTSSFIRDTGTGDLNISADQLRILNAGQNELKASFNTDGAVTLYHDNAEKLTTTSTGIDVTGTVTADGLTVDGSLGSFAVQASGAELHFSRNDNNDILANGGTSASFTIGANNNLTLKTGATLTQRLQIANNGDLSLFEDTGTTAKFQWSASNERLTIPTLTISDGSITTTASAGDHTVFNSTGADADFRVRTGANTHSLYIEGNTGNVGIGTNLPTSPLHIKSATNVNVRFDDSGSSSYTWYMNDAQNLYIPNVQLASTHTFYANGQRKVDIDSSGNLLVGGTSQFNSSKACVVGSISSATGGVDGTYTPMLFGAYSTATSQASAIAVSMSSVGTNCGFQFQVSSGVDANRTVAYQLNRTQHIWSVGGTEAARIDSSGNLLVGKSSQVSAGRFGVQYDSGQHGIGIDQDFSGSGTLINFLVQNSAIGSIQTNGTTTSYVTSSDERLKENITDANDAGDKIDAIKVRQYDWKTDGSHQDYGMVAQELMTVAPEAVSGDPESDDMMGVDYSKLVPMMLKEIQSLRARVAQLEGAN